MSASAYKEPTIAPVAANRHRKVGRVNYIIEDSTPAMMCLVRGAQSKAYTPLAPEDIFEAVQPHDLSLRPSPYTAHQALIDFYKICDGYYGVESEDVDLQQLTVGSHSKGHHGSGSTANVASAGAPSSHASSMGGHATIAPAFSSAAAALTTAAAPPLPSPDDPNIAEKLNDYRIAQLRRNAQHIDNRVYHAGGGNAGASGTVGSGHGGSTGGSGGGGGGGSGVCHFFRTPGGCHRGEQCPFLHLDKAGQVAGKNALSTGRK